ncbi:MAG: DUF5682 family protein [Bacteroidia bacterium]
MAVHILGIRHHGVGSAIKVKKRLEALKPDIILVEGAPEIDPLLPHIGHPDLRPPVAIMIYNPKDPSQSTFYPFAAYSPEWVAAAYANEHQIPVRAIDLPAAISFGQKAQGGSAPIHRDPMSYLAEAAGFDDGESWWDYQFEHGKTASEEAHFEAVNIAMTALRDEGIASSLDTENIAREAWMRELVRKAQMDMHSTIAVVCGAWHAPALMDISGQDRDDAKLLKKLPKPKLKLEASWIPWTNDRLSMFSGYGAGITSPGWYAHQWSLPEDIAMTWLTAVAAQFREEGMDISTAHVLESYRLAISLCQLRKKSHVTLSELNEAILTVMCMGDGVLVELIRKKLVVGNIIGTVPDDIPKVPLQQDFEKIIKSLRMKLTADEKLQTLDLRKDIDLKRSVLLHRLELLGITWATRTHSRTKGTFKEAWTLYWQPEMMITLIDKAYLGNTVEQATIQEIRQQSESSNRIATIARLINQAIPAELNDSIDALLNRIDALSSQSSDILDLMEAIPELVNISRYGNVRQSDIDVLSDIVKRLFTKICIGLPNACYGLDEDSSNAMFGHIVSLQQAIKIYDQEEVYAQWEEALHLLIDREGVHDIIRGCVCRLLLDSGRLPYEEAMQRIGQALSVARDPRNVASWIEGFLRGSGMILIYDHRLWNVLYTWVESLEKSIFMNLLPYLRRAFSRFPYGERRQVGQKAQNGLVAESGSQNKEAHDVDEARIERVFEGLDTFILS